MACYKVVGMSPRLLPVDLEAQKNEKNGVKKNGVRLTYARLKMPLGALRPAGWPDGRVNAETGEATRAETGSLPTGERQK